MMCQTLKLISVNEYNSACTYSKSTIKQSNALERLLLEQGVRYVHCYLFQVYRATIVDFELEISDWIIHIAIVEVSVETWTDGIP